MDYTKWVTPHLTGGIGNRLFEFAAAKGAAELWDIPLVFHTKYITNNDHGIDDTICKLFPKVPILHAHYEPFHIKEANGHCFIYTPFPSEPPSETHVIEGYRQSPKYFPKSQPLQPVWIREVSAERQKGLLEKYGLCTETEKLRTWFIHVRLGDYKVLPHHQINILPYYMECLDRVPKGAKVILFSDEPQLCGKWAEVECVRRGFDFQVCDEEGDAVNLWLMSQIWGGAIVANSTFSWWGAYFARHTSTVREKYRAFYPSMWGQGLPEARDIVPSWGEKIQVS